MFNVALNAGHYLGTLGKHCPKSLDPNMTKEWVLNARVVSKLQNLLSIYEDINVLRVDDPTGRTNQSFTQKRKLVNDFGAHLYVGVHHNAADKIFTGGGISAYVTINPTAESVALRDALYHAAVRKTGLKGDRANPLAERDLHELRGLLCPAVLVECGFMDSRVDCPIILTEEYADKLAEAFATVIIEKAGVTTKPSSIAYAKKELLVSVSLPVLKRGSTGNEVRVVQTLLRTYGANISIDGSFGPATDLALKQFQQANNLEVDGSCGANTWTQLLRNK